MATSSIFANVKIADPKKIDAFIEALDASIADPVPQSDNANGVILSDPDIIKELWNKRKGSK